MGWAFREIPADEADDHIAALLRHRCPPSCRETGLHSHVQPLTIVQCLEIELIPRPLWGRSVAQRYPARWEVLRRRCYRAARYRCEICGGRGPAHPVEAHERWRYEDDGHQGVQTLDGLIGLCPDCHGVKHLARTRAAGGQDEYERLVGPFIRVNQWEGQLPGPASVSAALDVHFTALIGEWERRSALPWSQDLSRFLGP